MTTQEFSAEFDVIYNNVTSNLAPGLNEYEKSVFLTKALALLINEYFNNRIDGVGGGFDGSQRRQYDFSSLIRTSVLSPLTIANYKKLDKRSLCFSFPYDYFLSVNEMLVDTKYLYTILPIDYNEYSRLMLKPYAYPVKKGAWRLITGRTSRKRLPSLSITYVPLPQYTLGSETRWYSLTANDIAGVSEISHGGTTEQIPYYNIETGEGTAQLPFIHDKLGIYYHNTAYWVMTTIDLNNPNLKHFYLFELGSPDANGLLTDKEVLEIFLAFSSLDEKEAFNAISVPDESTNFRKLWSEFGNYPQTATYEVNDDFEEVFVGNEPDHVGQLFLNITTNSTPIVELIGRFTGAVSYTIRYIKRPSPIILVDLDAELYTDVTIEGISAVSECELPEETHQEILERAVTLAKIAWQGGTATLAASASKQNKDD